jgi:ATPase, P-type (transporting), HAD superfamily, subfamily IC/ATPase, P-type (transporting), HAD superfamily, subfamily IC
VTKFYQQSTAAVLENFSVDLTNGLSTKQARQSREKHGPNQLAEKKADPYWKIFLKSFKEPIVIVLLGAVLLSFLSSWYAFQIQANIQHGKESLYEAIAILILIIINAFLGFWQEINAQKSLDALKEMNNRFATVLRNGEWQKIPTADLAIGDILKVAMGDFIEADVRWLDTNELQVIESHLTGEADAILKSTTTIDKTVEIGDRFNMGFSGSTVSNGQGIGVVTAIGEKTELGNIARMIQETDTKVSPLQATINQLTNVLMKVSAGIVIFTFVVGIIRAGEFSINSITSVLSTSIALAVASIPDALPAVLSIVLTIGATKMAKNKGLIKSLNSVETLGSTSYICSDKTGTLTKNEMTVTKFYDNGQSHDVSGRGYNPQGSISGVKIDATSPFLTGAVLCNEASVKEIDGKYKPFGNPTEVALNVLGQKAGFFKDELLKDRQIIRTLPFTSDRKMMSVIVKADDEFVLYTKGAPDVLLRNSIGILDNGKIDKSLAGETKLMQVVDQYADQALRTLAVGYRKVTAEMAQNFDVAKLETDLIITGVAGIIDPPREEVKQSVKNINDANIEVVMITGDHEKTARAIAYDLGIVKSKKAPVINGQDIEKMTDEQLFEKVLKTNIYARVSPEHKQRIVRQLQRQNQIVAMTGDGVNDAPALRAADIGIAMGINGTEVTKDSADLILLDDKFTTIEKSVKSGRTIYANIKNFMRHELTTNVAEVLALLLGLLLFGQTVGKVAGGTPTLTALMVLWVNMVSDALPSFALGYDVAESDIMKESPRDPNESVLANHTWSRVLIRGTFMGGLVYLGFLWAAHSGFTSNEAQTIAFLTLVFGQLWHVFDARSSKTLFRRNPFSNLRLILAVVFAGVTSILVTVSPFFNLVMGTAKLPLTIYPLLIIIPALPTVLLSGLKEISGIKIW